MLDPGDWALPVAKGLPTDLASLSLVDLVTAPDMMTLLQNDVLFPGDAPRHPFAFVVARQKSSFPKGLVLWGGRRGLAPRIKLMDNPLVVDDRRSIKQLFVGKSRGANQGDVAPFRIPTVIEWNGGVLVLMNVAVLESAAADSLFKDLLKLHGQAQRSRDRKAEGVHRKSGSAVERPGKGTCGNCQSQSCT